MTTREKLILTIAAAAVVLAGAVVYRTKNEAPGWKTYVNTKYQYSLEYPQNWFVDASGAENEVYCGGPDNQDCFGGILIVSNYTNPAQYEQQSLDQEPPPAPGDLVSLGVNIRVTNDALESLCQSSPAGRVIKRDEVSINGNQGIKCVTVTTDHPGGLTFSALIFKKAGKLYSLSYRVKGLAQESILENIYPTFKFTK